MKFVLYTASGNYPDSVTNAFNAQKEVFIWEEIDHIDERYTFEVESLEELVSMLSAVPDTIAKSLVLDITESWFELPIITLYDSWLE